MNGFEFILSTHPNDLLPLCQFINPGLRTNTLAMEFLCKLNSSDVMILLDLMYKQQIAERQRIQQSQEEEPHDL